MWGSRAAKWLLGVSVLAALAPLAAVRADAPVGVPVMAYSVPAPCGGAGNPPRTYDHVIWIWMENRSYSEVIGAPAAPFETGLARACGSATSYHSVGSPSLPNYIAATSGATQGINDDGNPADHRLAVDNLFRQVRAAGKRERSYLEDMPGNCTLTDSGSYWAHHNPAAYYVGGSDRAACMSDDVPLGSVSAGAFAHDLHSGLPALSVVVPNACHDTHDCAVGMGDQWLARWMPMILGSAAYTSGKTAVFVVWDDWTPMPNLVIAPHTPAGTKFGGWADHFSLLRTTEELLGLSHLGRAGSAPSLRGPFRL
jgi:hypothetical protein